MLYCTCFTTSDGKIYTILYLNVIHERTIESPHIYKLPLEKTMSLITTHNITHLLALIVSVNILQLLHKNSTKYLFTSGK